MSQNRKSTAIAMTEGSLWKNIFIFSIPLMCSQILEVLFNLSDVAVVGWFANYKALGSVGSTTLLLCTLIGLLVSVICILFSANMLSILHTKDELMDGAVLYMKIYALGMPAMGIYNFGNGVLSARGDTRSPLIYLTIAGVLNVILNLYFVVVLHMAADGVATASVIA